MVSYKYHTDYLRWPHRRRSIFTLHGLVQTPYRLLLFQALKCTPKCYLLWSAMKLQNDLISINNLCSLCVSFRTGISPKLNSCQQNHHRKPNLLDSPPLLTLVRIQSFLSVSAVLLSTCLVVMSRVNPLSTVHFLSCGDLESCSQKPRIQKKKPIWLFEAHETTGM